MIVERELVDFFNKIWRQNEGTVRLATKDREGRFVTTLFAWPRDIRGILDKINTAVSQDKDVFFSPDLFKDEAIEQRKFTKDLVKGSSVICLDFDGNAPQDDSWYGENGLPLPSMKVQSSSIDNQHVYWILKEFILDVEFLENIRRTITYNLKADSSGWDAGQLLRVPYTVNHKFGKKDPETYDVFIEEDNADERVYGTSLFPTTSDFRPLVAGVIDKANLPTLTEVLVNNDFIEGFLHNFTKVPDDKKRSDALMCVAYDAAESGLSNEEIYVLIVDADSRWEKYTHRRDKETRYIDLIERAKRKYSGRPVEINITDDLEIGYQRAYGFNEVRTSNQVIKFMFEGLLSECGYGILAGPPNVGKTQLAIRLGVACVLQTDFIGWENKSDRPMRVMLYSLEMSLPAIKYFVDTMTDLDEHLDVLQENFTILPLAELVDFTNKDQLKQVENDIETHNPDLIIIDSLSMAASESLAEDKTARNLNKNLKIIRKKAKCAVVSIHHSKKSQANKSMSGDMDDLYGSRFITAEADFVITFLPQYDTENDTKEVISIRAVNTKIRLGKWQPPVQLYRTQTLDFTVEEEPNVALPGFSKGKHSAGSSAEDLFNAIGGD